MIGAKIIVLWGHSLSSVTISMEMLPDASLPDSAALCIVEGKTDIMNDDDDDRC